MRRIVVLLAIFVPVLAAQAEAAQRFAAPDGTGTACTSAAPCSVREAIQSAIANDEVILAAGTYEETGDGTLTASVTQTIRAADGAASRPRIRGNSSPLLQLTAPNVALRDIELYSTGGSPTLRATADGTQTDRLIVVNLNSNPACDFQGDATMRDSGCSSGHDTSPALRIEASGGASHTLDLINVTLVARNEVLRADASGAGSTVTANVVNTLVYPRETPVAGPYNVTGTGSGGGAVTINTTNSSYATVAPNVAGFTVNDLGGRRTDGAFLSDAVRGDFRQRANSPTRNAGTTSGISAADFEGDPRNIGPAPDIGADESPEPAVVTTGAATALSTTSATLNGVAATGGVSGSYRFEYGPTTEYGATTPETPLTAATAGVPVSATISGLTPGVTYQYRLVVTRQGEGFGGANVPFTTATPPNVIVNPPVLKAVLSKFKVTSTKISFTSTAAGAASMKVERKSTGRRSGTKCVKTTVKNRSKKKCTRFLSRGAVSFPATAGANSRSFNRRVAGKTLSAGSYRASLSVTNAAGKSNTVRSNFSIKRKKKKS